MAKPIDPRRRFAAGSLGQRIFLLTSVLVILSVVASVVVARVLVGASVADQDVRDTLQRSTEVQRDLVGDRLEQLYLRALTVSGDPNFVAYLLQAIEDNDPASLIDQLDERQRDLGFDFAVVLDGDGGVVARTDLLDRGGDFTTEAPWRAAIEGGDYSADGLWARDEGLFYAVLVPLSTSGTLQGFLVAAYALGDEAAASLRQVHEADVVWSLDQAEGVRLAASTLGEREAADLVTWLAGAPPSDGTAQPVSLDGRNFLAIVEPVSDLAGDPIGRVINLGSLDQALAPYRRIGSILTAVGIAAVLLALIASWLLPRKLVEPIQRLADAAEAAAGGELSRSISGLDRADEVGRLARSFDHLLSSLREERDMQVYLTELTRTMPDPEGRGVLVTEQRATERREATLVGIELRGLGRRTANADSARAAIEELAQHARLVQQAVLVRGGELGQSSGHRVVALFDGPSHASRGLAAAAEAAQRITPTPVLAVATGTAVSGPAPWVDRPGDALSGPAVDAVEDLLRAAQPGSILLDRAARRGAADMLTESGVTAHEHQVGWSEAPIYAIASPEAPALAGPDVAATQNLATAAVSRTATPGTAVLQTAGDLGRMTLANVAPGRVLGGRFEILSELGAGGMGVVYKARDRELDEPVALKMLKHDAFDGDARALEGLKDELRMARRISHPNVLRTYDFGEADGFPFISMEFVRGVTLKQLLDQSGRLPLSPGLRLARQLCRGLNAAHEQSVLHRDIKPENMLLEHTGNLKLMDFGIAQPIRRHRPGADEATNEQVVGTPFYLAPEQLEGKEADVRADIYACGVVFYELFTGRLPYPGGNLIQIMQRKLNEDPPEPSTIWPEMPKPLEAIILRCLERDREARYPNVDTLYAAFDELRA